MNNIHFYDTCTLLNYYRDIFNEDKDIYISSITYKELEGIKTSINKDEETKYNARVLIKAIKRFRKTGKCHLILFKNSYLNDIAEFDLPATNDTNIIATAYQLNKEKEVIFVTEDLVCQEIASSLGIKTNCYEEDLEDDDYTGFKIVNLTELELANFYSNFDCPKNIYNLIENQYIIIKMDNQIVSRYRWANNKYNEISFKRADSKMFGRVNPKDGDIYQLLALDCLANSQITMLRGPAGSGKSYLAFAHMFSLLEKGKIDKIIIFCNTVAAKGAAKLGFYPGSKDEKLLDSQIGNFLSSKLGGKMYVEKLIEEELIVLLPMADIRGYDTTGMNAAIYITEAQNLDVELMRLALQRIGDDCICILDGDSNTQVDLSIYAGNNNGMRRVSKVFRGSPYYGEITLQNIHRSEIARLAQLL